jgi:hypothetical protein
MMSTAKSGHELVRGERGGMTNRRSLLAVVTGGIGALLSLPAQAHRSDPEFDAEPGATPSARTIRLNYIPLLTSKKSELSVRCGPSCTCAALTAS